MNPQEHKVYGLLGLAMKAGKVSFGTESCFDMLNRKKIEILLIAKDASERTINNFSTQCKEKKIPYYIWGTREKLSQAIGKENKTVLGIREKNFAQAVEKLIMGGDVIG